MTPDVVNGLFELVGAASCLLNVFRLARDKRVAGFHPAGTIFFTSWGYWNLFYYPSLGQWFSFLGGMALVIVNTAWLCQIAYYSYINKVED